LIVPPRLGYSFHRIVSIRQSHAHLVNLASIHETNGFRGMDHPKRDHRKAPNGDLFASLLAAQSRSRRLDDRIRRLCAQAVGTTDSDELNRILVQLTVALRTHTERVRQMAAMRSTPPERRQL
jgi:hypothetical protein